MSIITRIKNRVLGRTATGRAITQPAFQPVFKDADRAVGNMVVKVTADGKVSGVQAEAITRMNITADNFRVVSEPAKPKRTTTASRRAETNKAAALGTQLADDHALARAFGVAPPNRAQRRAMASIQKRK